MESLKQKKKHESNLWIFFEEDMHTHLNYEF